MSWIVTVIWIWLRILTRIHKADPLLWFYEELKHCRKLNNTIWLTDLLRAWHLSCTAKKKKKKSDWTTCIQSQNLFLYLPPKTSEANSERKCSCDTNLISVMPMDEGLKQLSFLSFSIIDQMWVYRPHCGHCSSICNVKYTYWIWTPVQKWLNPDQEEAPLHPS